MLGMMQNEQRLLQPFGDLQIGVVARREAQALGRHEIEVGSCSGGTASCTAVTTCSYWCGPVTASTPGCTSRMRLFLDAHATRDDDAAVLGQGLADGVEALLLGAVEEAAGVDDHDVGAGVVGGDLVALGAELGDDALAVDQRLRAAERDEADLRRGFGRAQGGRSGRSLPVFWRSFAALKGGKPAF